MTNPRWRAGAKLQLESTHTVRHGMARTHRAAARPPRSAPAAPCALRAGLRSTSAPRRFVRPRVPQPAAGAAPLPPQCGCLRLGRWPGAEGGGGPGEAPGAALRERNFCRATARTHARAHADPAAPQRGPRGFLGPRGRCSGCWAAPERSGAADIPRARRRQSARRPRRKAAPGSSGHGAGRNAAS